MQLVQNTHIRATLKADHTRPAVFILKLSQILGNPKNAGIIAWSKDDESVVIKTREGLEEVLTQYFKKQRYESFLRHLKLFGFQRHHKAKGDTYEAIYTHPMFKRTQPQLRKLIRKPAKGKRHEETTQTCAIVQVEASPAKHDQDLCEEKSHSALDQIDCTEPTILTAPETPIITTHEETFDITVCPEELSQTDDQIFSHEASAMYECNNHIADLLEMTQAQYLAHEELGSRDNFSYFHSPLYEYRYYSSGSNGDYVLDAEVARRHPEGPVFAGHADQNPKAESLLIETSTTLQTTI